MVVLMPMAMDTVILMRIGLLILVDLRMPSMIKLVNGPTQMAMDTETINLNLLGDPTLAK